MAVLGIVPARGGSKRIPDKNIAAFCGRPMMAYVLDAARNSGLFDKVHVSTDSPRIADLAGELGFAPEFKRPAELADDMTPLLPVLKWVVEHYAERGEVYDEVFLLMPCAPMIEADDLRAGHEVFRRHGGAKPLMAMAPYPVPVEWAFDLASDGAITAVDPAALSIRSQDLRTRYYDAGMFDIYSRDHLLSGKEIGEHGFVSVVVPAHKAVDIDTPEDWAMAEALYRGLEAARQ